MIKAKARCALDMFICVICTYQGISLKKPWSLVHTGVRYAALNFCLVWFGSLVFRNPGLPTLLFNRNSVSFIFFTLLYNL